MREEEKLRARVAEALASAGVGHGRVSVEVLYMLPDEFVQSYVRLFLRALREDVSGGGMAGEGKASGRAGDRMQRKGKPVGKRKIPGVGGGRRYRTHWVVRDEKALERKRKIDRRLRRIAAEMSKRKVEDEKCGGCGRFIERDYLHCPWCGQGKR
jgi:hypothetical protein